MTLLIGSGLDIHSLNNNGRTLLFTPLLADIYILLIEAGCDINHRDHNGQTAFDFLQSSQYDLALACSVHLKDRSPVIFKHLTYASVELMFKLNNQGIDFGIDNQCRLSIDETGAVQYPYQGKCVATTLSIIHPFDEKLTEFDNRQRLKTPLWVNKLQPNLIFVIPTEADKSICK